MVDCFFMSWLTFPWAHTWLFLVLWNPGRTGLRVNPQERFACVFIRSPWTAAILAIHPNNSQLSCSPGIVNSDPKSMWGWASVQNCPEGAEQLERGWSLSLPPHPFPSPSLSSLHKAEASTLMFSCSFSDPTSHWGHSSSRILEFPSVSVLTPHLVFTGPRPGLLFCIDC